MSHSISFIASLTVSPSDIRKITSLLQGVNLVPNPLNRLLITPLFSSQESMRMTEQMVASGNSVYFDSGGYYVQIGRLSYQDLYVPLLRAYHSNRWASIYTLPDHVPRSQDTSEEIEAKIRDTIAYSTLFFEEMPDELKSRAMPVVQGHNYAQVDACLDAYIRLGVSHIGFGSFGTVGASSEVNIATNSAVELAKYVAEVAHQHGMKMHAFGLGVPALIAMLKGIGVDSFDSSSWLKAAGFGQVFLPFMRAYNISHRTAVSEIQRGITFEQFNEWRVLTGHQCPYCDSLEELQNKKMYRAVHNLIVMAESVDMINSGNYEKIRSIYANGSKKYRNEFEKWLSRSD